MFLLADQVLTNLFLERQQKPPHVIASHRDLGIPHVDALDRGILAAQFVQHGDLPATLNVDAVGLPLAPHLLQQHHEAASSERNAGDGVEVFPAAAWRGYGFIGGALHLTGMASSMARRRACSTFLSMTLWTCLRCTSLLTFGTSFMIPCTAALVSSPARCLNL